jgi:hypothetical protein
MANRLKYSLLAIHFLALAAFFLWRRFGNLKELMRIYMADFLSSITICVLIIAIVFLFIYQKRVKIWMVIAAILLAFVPCLYLFGTLMITKQILIPYCVAVTSLLIIFRKEIFK